MDTILALIPLDGGLLGFDAHEFFLWFVENANYLFVFTFMIIESSFIPFPSEVVVPPAAYLAVTTGNMNIFVVCIVATAGALVGAFINYYLSLWIGRPLVYKFADSRIGHACLIDRQKVDKAEAYFDAHGSMSTFVGRLIPAVRQLISIPAGISRMNVAKFAIFTTLGALVWNGILCGLGWWLAQFFDLQQLESQIKHYNSYLSIAGVILLVVVVLFLVYNAMRKHNDPEDHSKRLLKKNCE
ncbi:MAG: DedA family protein [Muribaculaceae bacterium]|nr:DedA family protein [Muribaculaceae bacterium]